MKKVEMPRTGEEVAVTVEPKDEILIEGIPFETAQIDIIGTDVVVSDLDSGSRIVFPGMGLIMFERSLAPTISFGGQQVPINDFVSRVGEVGNLSVKDFIAISSIFPTDKDIDEVQSITSSDMQDGRDQAAKSDTDSTSESTSSSATSEVPTEQTVVVNSSSQSQIKTNSVEQFNADENTFTSDAPPNAVDEAGDEELAFQAPPASSGTPAVSSNDSVDEAPPEPENTLSFELRLLQVASQETTEEVNGGDVRTFLGGGGSQASFFNEENDSQFSTEVADFSNSIIPVVAQTDNPEFFSETLMSRVFQIEPTMPPGFFITELNIQGLPDNFDLVGFTRDEEGNFVIENPEVNNRGQINLIVQWEVPTYQEFTMDIAALAEFDEVYAAENGLEAPTNTELEFAIQQQVETDDAYSSNDLNYQNVDGDLVWVMANQHNQNRLITGAGDDDLTGAIAVDVMNAGGGNDVLRGMGGDDVLSGEDGNDVLIGGAGNDTYVGGNGVDVIDYTQVEYVINADLSDVNIDGFATITIDAFGENEEIELTTGVENIDAGTGNDILIGNSNANELRGNGGDDILMGRGGNDRLDGGGGIDTASYELAANGVNVNLAADIPTATVAADINVDILISIENITGSNYDDIILGDDENNFIFGGAGDDRLNGGSGNDILDGGDGNDFLDYSTSLDRVNLNLNAVPDVDGYITATVGTDSDLVRNVESVIGSSLNDNIVGSSANNTLIGNDGNDTLSGGDGADTFDGGTGNDIMNGDAGNDFFTAGLGQDLINGGDGIDTIDYSQLGADSIDATLNDGNFSSIVVAGEGFDNDTVQFIESVIGTDGDDRIVGDSSDNTLRGGAGNDFLAGRIGVDTLDGGDGIDTADFTQAGGAIDIELRTNSVIDDGDGFSDVIIDIENILGSEFGDTILGSDSVNTLDGFNGDDTLAGRGGEDTLNGGSGTDTADYSAAAGSVTVDLVNDVTTDDGDGATDNLDSIENIRGSAFGDLIIGSDVVDNFFEGMAGNDIFIASQGSDTIDGGDGLDTINYSAYTDATSIQVALDEGNDSVITLVGELDGDVHTVRFVENIIGTTGQDELRGDAASNRLDGFEGNDTIYGGLGDDTLIGGDGYDILHFSDFDGLATGITLNLVTENAGFEFDDSEDNFSEFEEYYLTAQDDTVFGSGEIDRVYARAGDDTIIASGGADILDGGIGFDTVDYSGFLAQNAITVDLDGVNQVSLTVTNGSVDLLSNIENITGSQGNDSITGDGEINIFYGDQGNDFLSGEGGDDILEGGLGNDTLRGGAGDDILRGGNINNGQGDDTADYQDSTDFIFADMTEGVVSDGFGGTDTLVGIDNITASANDDILAGNAFRNNLIGLDGDDRISGGGESDFMDGGDHTGGPNGGDTLTFLDLIDGFVDVNLQLGTADYSFDGSTDTFQNFEYYILTNQNDRVTGSDGVDDVEFRAGDDRVTASAGIDIFDGGVGSDTIDYSGLAGVGVNGITIALNEDNEITVDVDGGDNDRITGFENVTGSSQNDDIRGDGLANTLSGSLGNDIIRGGAGSDVFDGGEEVGDLDQLWFDDLTGSGVTINFDQNNAIHTSYTDTFTGFEEFYMSNQLDIINSYTGTQVVYGLGGDDVFNASSGSDVFDGGFGSDLVDYSVMAAAQSIDVTLNGDADATVTITTASGSETDTIRDIENIRGTAQADTITGDADGNTFYGGSGQDTLDGGAGEDFLFGENDDDILKGRGGTDQLNGGFGRDTADYSDAAINGINVNMALFTVSDDGDGGGDSLISIENIRGSSFGDNIIGDDLANYIWGEDGNDIIRGGEGNDQFWGGEEVGDLDILRFDDLVNDGIILDIQAGTATYIFNNDVDTFAEFERYFGTNLGDTIAGSSEADDIRALDGDDTFTASNGADYLDGGLGNDTIDYSNLTNAGIGVSLAIDTTNEVTATLVGTGVSNDTVRGFENVTGSIGADTISGDILNNTIVGHDGDDVLSGRGGQDDIYGGREDGTDNSSNDTVDYSLAAGSVTVDLSLERALSDGDSSTDNLYGIENVIGSLVVDDLRGDGNDNILSGNFGNDTLYGAGGNDTLDGGDDDDFASYERVSSGTGVVIDMRIAGNPQVTNDGEGGQDTLLNIENIRGTDYADDMTGDDFNNIIEGGQGEDILRGQGGDDTLRGGSNTDTVDYTFAGSSVSVDLSQNITSNDGQGGQDTLDSIENVIGSTVNDIIVGSGTSNVLDGNDGDDTLRGLGGNDTLDGGNEGVNGDTADYVLAGAAITVDMSITGSPQVTDDGDLGQDTLVDIENITGSNFADDITGDDNANVIRGGLEADILEGRGGNDTIYGGDAIDTLAFRSSTSGATVDLSSNKVWDDGFGGEDDVFTVENILGSGFADDLTGDSGNNTIDGGDGNDILRGRAGTDVLNGGAGDDDTIDYSLAATAVEVDMSIQTTSNDGDGTTDSFTGIENVNGSNFNDIIAGDDNALGNYLFGGAGDDSLYGAGADDVIDGGINGATGDTADYTRAAAAITVDMALGANQVSDDGDGGQDTLIGIENITGSNFDDDITGDGFNNRLRGGQGEDTLDGAGGDDLIEAGANNDTIIASLGADIIDGEGGVDTLDYSGLGAANFVSVTLQGSNNATVTVDGAGDVDTVRNVENVRATDGNDYLAGDDLANTFWGLEGDDRFIGSGGTDTYQGGEDLDNLDQDVVDYSAATQRVVVDLSSNVATEDGTGATDNIFDIENVIGSNFADIIQGDANANVLEGRNQDDTFVYSGGGDTIDGGIDSDTMDYSTSGATSITVALDGGNYTTVTVVDGDDDQIRNIENIIATDGDDDIRGDGQANTITLGDGANVVRGGLLSDTFIGGADYDTVYWDDLSGGIVLNLTTSASGTAYFAGDDSTDNFSAIEEYHTTDFADQITGSSENDLVYAGAGADTFFVSGGNDTFDGQGNDSGDPALTDTINYSTLDATNYIDVTLNGNTAVDVNVRLTANDAVLKTDSIVRIENVTGSQGNDTITGDGEANILRGDRGDDIIDGGAGNDRLYGDDGADTFLASSGQNTMYGGQGIDTVDYSADPAIGSISVTLQGEGLAGVLVDAYSDDFVSQIENVIGTAGTDFINGDDQVNILEGRGGDDRISGGGGLDTLDGGAHGLNGDTVDYSVVLANDLVDITLDGANDSTVTIGGIDADIIRNFENVIGSLNRDTIRGDANINRLDGNTGDDVLVSNGGQDTLVGGDGSDTLDISQDIVHADSAISLSLRGGDTIGVTVGGVANTFYMLQVENVIGSSQGDYIAGDSQINILEGRDGDDTIRGTGGDTVDGGTGTNTIDHSDLDVGSDVTLDMTNLSVGYGGENYFDVTIAADGTYQAARFRDIITGRGDDDVTGDAQDNTITTGEGDDTVRGGDGIDTISTGSGDDTVYGDDGDDDITTGDGSDTVYGGLGNDTINTGNTGQGGDVAYGEEGDDIISARTGYGGDGNDQISALTAYGDDGDDILNVVYRGEGGAGNDTITGDGNHGVFDGGEGDDDINAGGGNDTIIMSVGNDDLDGGSGTDYLRSNVDLGGTIGYRNSDFASLGETSITIDTVAGTYTLNDLGDTGTFVSIENIYTDTTTNGADIIRYDLLGEVYTYGGDDYATWNSRNGRIDLGAGTGDTIDFSEQLEASSGWTLEADFGSLVDNFVIVQMDGSDSVELIGAENIIGSEFADRIETADSGSTLTSISTLGGNDSVVNADVVATTIDLGDGDDSVNMWTNSSGNAYIDGGAGVDTVTYNNSSVGITVVLGEADVEADVVKTNYNDRDDVLVNIENISGSNIADHITGNSQTNVLRGRSGADMFIASGGQDEYYGDGDSDTVDFSTLVGIYGITGITLLYDGGTTDNSLQDVILNGGGEGNQRVSYSVENIIATSGDDTLAGTALNNRFETGAGDDYIYLSAGFDQLLAGNDADTLDATTVTLAGNTGLTLDAQNTVVSFDGNTSTITGFETFHATDGIDTVTSSNAVDETFFLYAQNDYYNASEGQDTVDGGTGVDTIDYSRLNTSTGVSMTLDGDNQITVTVNGVANSNDLISSFQHVVGSSGNDSITGDGLANTINGLSGNDTIDGAGGDDYIIGGLGVDAIDGGTGVDTVDYTGGQAVNVDMDNNVVSDDGQFFNDTIDNVEIVLGSSQDDTIIGDDLDNELYGNAGDDVLQGREGDDLLDGGGDSANGDTASFSRAAGSVTASIADGGTTVGGDGDGGTDTFVGIENLTGSGNADFLTGSGGANVIDGGDGNDTLYSTAGDDTYIGGTGDDDFIDFTSAGQRIVIDLDAGTVAEDGYGTSDSSISGVENVRGTALNDIVTTSIVSNDLELGLGDDTIIVRGQGTNNYDGGGEGASGDTVDYSNATGAVTANLSSSASQNGFGGVDNYTSIENLIGSDFDDQITGSASANTINTGDGDDTVFASDGIDNIDAGEGVEVSGDTINFSGVGQGVNINLATGAVTNDGFGNTGTASNFERIIGSAQGDVIVGTGSGDYFDAGAGDDVITGGGGNDNFIAGSGNNSYDGEGGNSDLLDYSAAGAIVVDLSNNRATNNGFGGQDDIFNIERLIGSGSGDSITSNSLNNTINAGDGNDTIYSVGGGTNILNGQNNDDTISYENLGLAINGQINGTVTYTGGTDTLSNFEILVGSALGDTITSNSGDRTINAGGGDDTVYSIGGGTNTFDGGAQASVDTLDYSTVGSAVTLNLAGTSATYTGGSDSFSNFERINLTNDVDDITTASGGTNNISVYAGDGADTVTVQGNQAVYGEAGNDVFTMASGATSAIIDGGSNTGAGDTLTFVSLGEAATSTTLVSGTSSIDTASTSVSFTGIENLIFSNAGDSVTQTTGAFDIDLGNGNDTIFMNASGVVAAASDYDGGGNGAAGDTLNYASQSGVTVNLNTGSATHDGQSYSISNFENIVGTAATDTLTSGSGNNDIQAGGGDDTVYSIGGGTNTFDGGAHASVDTLDYSTVGSAVTLDLSGSSATYTGGSDSYSNFERINLTNNADSITTESGGTNSISVYAGGGDDNVTLQGNQAIYGDGGNDTFTVATGASNATIDGGSNTGAGDTLTFASLGQAATSTTLVSGTSTIATASTSVNFTGIENLIFSNAGETVTQTTGAFDINLGGGNDTIFMNASGIVAAASDYDGGNNSDTLNYASQSGVTVNLNTGSATHDGQSYSISNFENIIGTAATDTLTSGSGSNDIQAGGGDDTVYSIGGGTNTFDGGAHASVDTLDYSTVGSAVTLDLSGSSATYTGGSDSYSNFERINLTGNADSITTESGGTNSITVYAGGGDDNVTLQGNQEIYGDGGNDTFTVASGASNAIIHGGANGGAGDTLTFATIGQAATSTTLVSGTSSIDTASTSVSFTGIENLIFSNSNDSVTQTTGAFDIDLGGGDDTLYMNASGAVAASSDYDAGGNGATGDTIDYTAQSGVTVNLNTSSATHGGQSYSINNFENVVGTAATDNITSGSGNNDIDAAGGDDTINSIGGGTNTFDGGAHGGSGDTVNYSTVGSAINGTINGTITYTGGSDSLSNIENVTGTGFNDVINGDGGANTINGAAGDDTLYGGAGNDVINGGGNTATGDTLTYASATGSVTVDLSGGAIGSGTASNDGFGDIDTITGIEHITGSEQADNITADAGSNTLYGLGGGDTINGGGGADTIYGGEGTDTLNGGDAGDTIYGGNDGDTINGDDGDDFLYGEAGVDIIDGGAGNDTIDGGFGGDTIFGRAGNDTITAGFGADNIDGGDDFDTVTFASSGTGISSGSFDGFSSETVVISGNTTSVNNVEDIIFTSQSDSITMNEAALDDISSVIGNIDFGSGAADTVIFSSNIGTTLDGSDFAGALSNVDVLDFSGVTFTGGATSFAISNSDTNTLTDGGNSLTILIDGTNITHNDFDFGTVQTDTGVVGNARTITWSDGTEVTVQS